jgi:hypothetical protein
MMVLGGKEVESTLTILNIPSTCIFQVDVYVAALCEAGLYIDGDAGCALPASRRKEGKDSGYVIAGLLMNPEASLSQKAPPFPLSLERIQPCAT